MDTEKYKTTIHNLSQSLKRISNFNQIESLLFGRLESPLHIKKLNIISSSDLNEKKIIINNPNIFIHKEFADETLFNWM